MRTLSLPAVSAEIVSAAGNLIFVFVSPTCIILSPKLISVLAVITPTESTFATSSYVNTPVNVAAAPTILLIVKSPPVPSAR